MNNGADFRKERARRIDKARLMKGWTRTQLADAAGYSEKTVFNLLAGKAVHNLTVVNVCQSLGIEPELEDESQFVEVADAAYGEYPRGPHRKFEGGYFAYRRSFSSPARLMRTCFEIEWAEDEGLIFREHSQFQSGRRQVDNSQSGRVHISQTTGLVHLVTSVEGSVRLITLTKMIGGEDVMRGAVLTQIDRAAYYLPAFSPIVLRKLRDFDLDKHRAMVGPIDDSAEEYEFICEELAHTERRVIEAAVRSSEPLASFATA
jgi:transcriptional regulator with XRE-family HTH domain